MRPGQRLVWPIAAGAGGDAVVQLAEILVELAVDEIAAIGVLVAGERIVGEDEVEARARIPVPAAWVPFLSVIIIVEVLGGEERLADPVEIAEMLDRLDALGRLSLVDGAPQRPPGLDREDVGEPGKLGLQQRQLVQQPRLVLPVVAELRPWRGSPAGSRSPRPAWGPCCRC